MAKTPLKHAEEHGHHVVSTSTSFMVLIALAVLMAATIGASFLDLGAPWINNVVAMAIASLKAYLVMMFFMGLKWATKLTRLWAGAGFVAFSLMFIILFDYNTRSNEIAPSWSGQPEPATPRVVNPKLGGGTMEDNPMSAGFRPRKP